MTTGSAAASDERVLVTGALGCIGSWVVRHLARDGIEVVAADLATEPVRPRLIMTDDELARVRFVQLDVTDLAAVRELVERERITRIVHLAALQIPHCNANPSHGARVNVQGTVNIFEAVRQSGGQVRGLAYASSIAVLGPLERYAETSIGDDVPLRPSTLYGVYKQANEGTARLYRETWGVPSVGLRPAIVYGVGRDQGMTSDATKAMLAAAAGQPFQFGFGGLVAMQYAPDVAAIFVRAALAGYQGTGAFNLRGSVVTVDEVVDAIEAVVPGSRERIEVAPTPLPVPADLSDAGLRGVIGAVPHTPLGDATRETIARFRALLATGATLTP
jgi:nucleoside-diphosphate-sugar epimerase